jgi:hypothetical protein
MPTSKPERKGLLEVDKFSLDDEWSNQPNRFKKHADILAEAKQQYELAKAKFDLVKAELDELIRIAPQRFKVNKVTDVAVANAAIRHPKYQKYQRRMIRKKYRVDVLQATVTALDHRKKALENIVDLFGMDYFSIPKAKTEVARKWTAEKEKQASRRYNRRGEDS